MRNSRTIPATVISFVLAAIAVLVLMIDGWPSREPDALCDLRAAELDGATLGLNTAVAGMASGTWTWWPTGLTCRYLRLDGGYLMVSPNPLLSIALVIAVVGVVIGITLLIISSISTAGAT
jgi:hypothetical protein